MSKPQLSPAERERLDELHGLVERGNYYELLGVSRESTAKDIQRAYHELARAWHPDRYSRYELGDYKERLETIFAHFIRACKTLMNETERVRYNADLDAMSPPSARARRPPPSRPPAPQPSPPAEDEAVVHEVEFKSRSTPSPDARPGGATGRTTPPTTPAAPRPSTNPIVNALRGQVRERLERSRRFYLEGKKEYDAGNYLKAVNSLKLAVELDPKSELYQQLYEDARTRARKQQATHFVQQGKLALENHQDPVAIENFRRALEYDPEDAMVYFRVGKWAIEKENDPRTGLQMLRRAVEKEPASVEYRLALADHYVSIGMGLNARREYQTVLDRDKKNERAKAGLAKARG